MTPNSGFIMPRQIKMVIKLGMVYGMNSSERMSFLNGNFLSLNMMAIANPSEKVESTLINGKMKFQIMIRTNGPRKAGLVTKPDKVLETNHRAETR